MLTQQLRLFCKVESSVLSKVKIQRLKIPIKHFNQRDSKHLSCVDFFSSSSCRTWALLKVVAWATSGSRFKSPTCSAFPWWSPSTSLSEMQLLDFSLIKQTCSGHPLSEVPFNNIIHQDWHSVRDWPRVSACQRGRGLGRRAVPPLGPGRTRLAGVGPGCERGSQQAQPLPVSLRRSGGNELNQ